ncbi:hypothetical protein LZ30DRAFT_611621, partial [Colletotrichum cereale]
GERTGSRVFQWVWSYVLEAGVQDGYSCLDRAFSDIVGSIGPDVGECVVWLLSQLMSRQRAHSLAPNCLRLGFLE